jgi:hypothetical protein
MGKLNSVVTAAILMAASPSLAAAQDICGAVLTESMLNIEKRSETSSIMLRKRDDLCSRTYDSVQEAQSSARQSGFDIGYGALSIGASDAKQNSSGKWEIHETNFCRATAEDFASFYSSESESRVATIAVEAWRDCVLKAQDNRLYLEFSLKEGATYFTGTLYRTVAGGTSFNTKITGINAVGEGKNDVSCNIAGKAFAPGELTEQYQIQTTKTAVSCEKSKDVSVSVAFQTDSDSLPFVDMPSSTTQDQTRIDELAARVDSLASAQQKEKLPIGTVVSSMLSEAQFREIYGSGWVLADGRAVAGTAYAKLIAETAPDLRGVFLRGMTLGRDGKTGDPDGGERVAGSYQADALIFHQHEFNRTTSPGPGEETHSALIAHANSGSPRGRTNFMLVGENSDYQSLETRPRNVAVYFYIRVD